MNKLLALLPLALAMFALMLSPAIMSAYAVQPENKPDACDPDNPGVSRAVGNKHCNDDPPPGTQFTNCDDNKDGQIDASELTTYGVSDVDNIIEISEDRAGSKGKDNNNAINTIDELNAMTDVLVERAESNPCSI